MAIDNMQGKVTTTGMLDQTSSMPKGKVDPQLQTQTVAPKPEPKPEQQPVQQTMDDNEEMTPIEQEIVNRAESLTDEDREVFINILSPSVVNVLSKLLPEFSETMEELSGDEPNVIFPLSTIQRYAQSKYGGESADDALQTFVSDVISPDASALKQQLDNQTQTNVPPRNQMADNTPGLMQPDTNLMQPDGSNPMMPSPQNMETV